MNDNKFAFFLPNSFTAMNLGCGFIAIMFSIKGDSYSACMFLLLGAIFDSVDGRVARMTGTSSAFGEQFDSLSDLISFGIAPAIIFYNKFLIGLGRVGMVVSFLYLLCGALRLARFNANISKVSSNYFQGLPIPGAAIAVLSYVLVSKDFASFDNKFITIPYIIIYSLLMISNIPFPSFKGSPWVKKNKKKVFFLITVTIMSLFIYEELMIPIVMTLYVLISMIYVVFNREQFSDVFDWDEAQEVEAEK